MSLLPHGDGKRVLQTVRQDAALSTRHSAVLLIARTRVSLPVLELANTRSVPVVYNPFDLEIAAFDGGSGIQPARGGSTGVKRCLWPSRA